MPTAFGDAHGFLAAWSYWVSNLTYLPSMLFFLAAAAAFVGGDGTLGDSPVFAVSVSLLVLVFLTALNNVKPMVEVKSRRVGGANYQVPVEVRPIRRMALAMRWLKESARKRSEKSMAQRLANELLEACEGRGGAMKKRDEVHRMAEANKAFSHFRF